MVESAIPVLVIGGGLSGLLSAVLLQEAGIECRLIEARPRLGGRIRTQGGIDLGPSWFWPGQARIEALIRRLSLSDAVFDQAAIGLAVDERADGTVVTRSGLASMQGSRRLGGGLETLTAALRARLDPDVTHLGCRATALHRAAKSLVIDVEDTGPGESDEVDVDDGAPDRTLVTTTRRFHARHVVLALPPRLVSGGIRFSPALPDTVMSRLDGIPTWMAGQAKFAAVYARPFWREAGLSGDAASQRGPLVEIHDASAASGPPHALFGFVGVPAAARHLASAALIDSATRQLARLFGAEASRPIATHLLDWAFETCTANAADREGAPTHPPGGPPDLGGWNDRIVWAGSETAAADGHAAGYLEGAVQAAERAARAIIDSG